MSPPEKASHLDGDAAGQDSFSGSQPHEQACRRLSGFGLLAGHDVAVGVEGEADRSVAEALADDLHVDAGGEQVRGSAFSSGISSIWYRIV